MHTNSPVYLDIANALRKEVARRHLAPHSKLPSEPEVVKKYRVARATVRRALAELQREGLIYTRQAVGSFVAESRVDQDLDQLFSFTEFMVYRHLRPGTKLLAAEVQRIVEPDSPILYYLGLKPGARVIYVRRLRLGGGDPLVIANTWLPEARYPAFLKQDIEHESVYEIMRKLDRKPTDAVQTFEAVTLNQDLAGLLTVPPGSAALLIRRVGYANGIPVEYAIDYYRGDRTKFRARLGVLEQRVTDRIRDDHIAI